MIYNPAGAATAMRLGNWKWENTVFNSRMQPTQIGLGHGSASQDQLKLNYSYGTTANNGNVVSQTITAPGVSLPFVQNYTYDSLNRIEQADEKPSGWIQSNCDGDPSKCWKQTFKYDRYGNRNFNTTGTNTTTLRANFDPKIYKPTIDTDDNRFEAGQGYSYDAAGNTTRDAESRRFTYDAENKQTKVETLDANGNPIATVGEYFYDGDGKRIKKVVPGGETTVFVYDAGGKLIGEYSTVVQPIQDAKTVYTTNDHLGSPRINTDATGQVISRHDYHPFGEEIARTGYGPDTLRKQFTGYERDNESELDYAINRYYNGSHGRFTSVDPYNIIFEKEKGEDADEVARILNKYLADPQNWNRYLYVVNNPLKYSDPDGLRPQTDQERKDLDYLRNLANTSTDADFKRAVLDAVKGIEHAIAASQNQASDPRGLKIALWAANRAAEGDTSRFGLQGTARLESNNQVVAIGPTTNPGNPQWKCNIFVAAAQVLGGNIPLGGNGLPTSASWTRNFGNVRGPVVVNIPSANTWASMDSNAVANYELMASPQQGDVVAWKLNGPNGHAAISIGGNAVIYASADGVKVQTINYVSNVQQYGAAVYRRKKE